MMKKPTYKTIDQYIKLYPKEVQEKLKEIRKLIQELAPEATEKISYGIPTFYLNGNLIHFAAYAKHIGFYPGANGIATFEAEIKKYKYSKGAIQFTLDEKIPFALIKKIVKFRVKENRQGPL